MSDQDNNPAICGCCSQNNTESVLYNASGLSALKYRIGTHGSFKKEMLAAISRSGALTKLTSRYNDDFAIATLDAWATVLDILSFYQERICNEGYLCTAIERLSVVYLAQHIHYVPAPGVSAETYLAFSMSEAQGAPPSAIIPRQTKVQSIPKQNQLPQIFETAEDIEAKVKWNKINPQSKLQFQPKAGDSIIYIDGTQTGLQSGDKILFVSSEPKHDYNSDNDDWDFRSIIEVSVDAANGYSVINLDAPIGQGSTFPQAPAPVDTQIVMKAPDYPNLNWMRRTYYNQRATTKLAYRTNFSEANAISIYEYSPPIIKAPAAATDPEALKDKTLKVYAMRQKANLFGYNAPDFRALSGSAKLEFIPRTKGLAGMYFSGINFDTFLQFNIDNSINFSISADMQSSTFPISQKYNFSVRWDGLILAPYTGTFTFYLISDDSARLWIDEQILLNSSNSASSATFNFEAGKFYIIRLDYTQSNITSNNPAIIQLYWSSDKINKEIIPTDFLFHINQDLTEWPGYAISTISSKLNTIYLDALYPKIIQNSMLVMANPEQGNKALFCIQNTADSLQSRFMLTSKTTKLELSSNQDLVNFDTSIRNTFIYAQSEELQLAGVPITAPLNNNQITLETLTTDLFTGQKIFISGKPWRLEIPVAAGEIEFTPSDSTQPVKYFRDTSLVIVQQPVFLANDKLQYTVVDDGGLQGIILDDPDPANQNQWKPANLVIISSQKNDEVLNEFHTIKLINFLGAVDSTQYGTLITLNEPINNYFDLQTVNINANVASANHGETKLEVLGNGNSSQIFQKFQLRQQPLTFTSADTPSGSQTSLEIQVNNIKWTEVLSFFGTSSKDKIYTVTIADDGTVTVCFGDGITGARLPTGTGNVKAIYRTGIGSSGLMDADQLSMLVTPQLGVSKVTNPLASDGEQDAETIDTARKKAPFTVLTLDRIVSATDFENFTRAFAGIGKAKANVTWNGEQEIVNITAALADGTSIQPSDKVYNSLLNAFQDYGHTNATINIDGYLPVPFTIDAAIAINENYEFDDVKQNVATALAQSFSFEVMNFGEDVTTSQIINVIQKVDGVLYTRLNSITNLNTTTFNAVQPNELLLIDVNNSNITQLL